MVKQLISSSHGVTTQPQLKRLCADITETLGVDYYLIALFTPLNTQHYDVFLINNYPEDWMEWYFEHNYRQSDPVLEYAKSGVAPILWHRDFDAMPTDQQEVMEKAVEYGLKDGISIPIHGKGGTIGVFSVANSEHIPDDKAFEIEANMLSIWPYLHSAMSRVNVCEPKTLTDREKEVLTWTAEGKTSWEASQIIGVSESTINFHIKNCINKLDAVNRHHAIAKAIIGGVIAPDKL
ncbi:helix-turn-helix transcriptional regulator [Vibrio penaeicida]|uniref:helix-turn-helix transcriptional regulator n=1 Tax=Vibrio penaeicida TaxID=104609 RepID=UPI000CE9C0E4|nr:LuxR family transcriptional regulator [Vibrio penaeicida]